MLHPAGNLPYVATERGAMFYCDAKHQKKTLKLLLRNVGPPLRALLHVRRPEGGREGDYLWWWDYAKMIYYYDAGGADDDVKEQMKKRKLYSELLRRSPWVFDGEIYV